jgi:hypothetical protein
MASLWTESARQSHTAFRRLRCEAALTEPTSPSRPRVPPLSGLQRSRDRHSYCTKVHTVAYRYWDHRIRQIRSICSAIRSWARRWGCHVRGAEREGYPWLWLSPTTVSAKRKRVEVVHCTAPRHARRLGPLPWHHDGGPTKSVALHRPPSPSRDSVAWPQLLQQLQLHRWTACGCW